MYHSTKTWQQAESILDNGFYPSDHSRSMLGEGIYASSIIEKTRNYGPITFKLLVYPGRICTIKYQDHPLQKAWQSDFGSAWTPPYTHGMVKFQVCAKNYSKAWNYYIEGLNILGKLSSIEWSNSDSGCLPRLRSPSVARTRKDLQSWVSDHFRYMQNRSWHLRIGLLITATRIICGTGRWRNCKIS